MTDAEKLAFRVALQKERSRRYDKSPEGLARRAAYRQTEAARSAARAYASSGDGKNWRHRRAREKRFIVNGLKSAPCMDCGGRFPPVCMDFDHRDGVSKRAGISEMVSGTGSIATMLEEIAKCDLVCANCHRIRTQKRHGTAGWELQHTSTDT